MLLTNKITFCRFADDYHLFTDSPEEAYSNLVFFSEKLLENEGLLLQKTKTRVMSSEEFLSASEFSSQSDTESTEEKSARNFLSLRLHFDPYSVTASDDYEKLREDLSRFDVVGMLTREMRKSRVHQALTKKLISSLKHLDPAVRDDTIVSLVDNLSVLYPVFPNVMLLIKGMIDELNEAARSRVFDKIRSMIKSGSYIVTVPTHLAYAVRVLAHDQSDETDEALSRLYQDSNNILVRRDVILSMAKRGADYWISDVRKNFATLSSWERLAILISSYILDDEGSHWRSSVAGQLSPVQKLAVAWAGSKKSGSGRLEIPL